VPKKKDFSGDPGGLIGDAIFSAIKPLYKEGEKAKKMRRPSRRAYYYTPEPKVSQKDIVFGVLSRAIQNAGSLFSARDLYYATRPLCYAHPEWEDGKQLDYRYFSQALLTEYQERRGPIEGLWRDPRGHLHEPHTARVLALGTREVAAYDFPPYTFDKVLYVEKEGEMPKLKAAKLAERYDMAVASGKGYPAEAVRTLFERAEGGDYQLFVFHDADIDGYNIARVMREATRRMPGYSVEVADIGLTVEDALEMNLDPEPFSRKKDIPWSLRYRLSEEAEEYFVHRHERFELNAILPDTSRIEYIERKLEENGVRGKVIPPDDKLSELADEKYRTLSAGWASEVLDELIAAEDLKKEIADEFIDKFGLSEARSYIEDHFDKNRAASWREALETRLEAIRTEHADAFKAAVEKKLREHLDGGSA
jgi:hypothetical protein